MASDVIKNGSVFEIHAEKKPTAKVVEIDEGKIAIPQLREFHKAKVINLGSVFLVQPV